jgi:DNA-directed RNA polymerase subunit RPC12/RpoP
MTVRIIEQEVMPEALKRSGCYRCGAVLEYTMFDTKERKHTDISGSTEMVRLINCPKCGHEVTVK